MDLSAGEIAAIFASGLATGLGGLALLIVRRPSDRLLDALMGFTAGIMFAAAIFSLLVPALDRGSLGEVVTGFLLGAATLAVLDAGIPHIHAPWRTTAASSSRASTRRRSRPVAVRCSCCPP